MVYDLGAANCDFKIHREVISSSLPTKGVCEGLERRTFLIAGTAKPYDKKVRLSSSSLYLKATHEEIQELGPMNLFEQFTQDMTRRYFFKLGSHAVGWAALAS